MKKYIYFLFVLLFASSVGFAQEPLNESSPRLIEIKDPIPIDPTPMESFVFDPSLVFLHHDGGTVRVTLYEQGQLLEKIPIKGPITIDKVPMLDLQLISVTNNGSVFEFKFAANTSDAGISRSIRISFSYQVTAGNGSTLLALGSATLRYNQPAGGVLLPLGGVIACDTTRLYNVGEQPPLITSKESPIAEVGAQYSWEKKSRFDTAWKTIPGKTQATCMPDIMGEVNVSYRRKYGSNYSNTITLKSYNDSPLPTPTKSENYLLETTYTSPVSGTDVITYYDGLGRTVQTVSIAASPVDRQDIVSFFEYDFMGRNDAVTYLPYVSLSKNGAFRVSPLTEQQNFYKNRYQYYNISQDSDYAFGQKEYDRSGLGLVLAEGGPGKNHQITEAPRTYEYGLNDTWGPVKKFAVAANGDLLYKNSYSNKQLTAKAVKQRTVGDTQSVTIKYHDSKGNLVASELHISPQDRQITYYVYDDLGRQRYIIPPSVDITAPTTALNQLTDNCFYTEFDEYGRVFKQYVPGASYTLSIYDKRGRLALTQDGNQRSNRKWSFTKYDHFDRPVMTGVISGGTYESHKAALEAQAFSGEAFDLTNYYGPHHYTNQSYPIVNYNDVFTVFFYDTYNWLEERTEEDYYYRPDIGLNNTPNYKTKGLVTGKKVRVLDSGTPQWLSTITYYDSKYQVIQTIGDLYPQGKEYVSNAYNYTGNVVEALVRQTTPSGTHEYRKWFDYDQMGRLLSVDQQITGDTKNGRVTIASHTYDELGRSATKNLHNASETVTYGYDIKGANTSGSSPLFSYNVHYDTFGPSVASGARYDHKPAGFSWSHNSEVAQGYKYSYDLSGQLTDAIHYRATRLIMRPTSTLDEKGIKYDKNGNIKELTRTGFLGDTIHDLSYFYRGNQLMRLICDTRDYSGYEYDLNGNLTKDPAEGLRFVYNEMNLPSRIFGNAGEVRYIYDSEGQKLATLFGSSFTYYRSVMVYGGGSDVGEQLLHIFHPEGVIVKETGQYAYKYHLTDYLGNVRTVASADNSTHRLIEEQRTNYYPYGLAHSYNDLQRNRYLFSGKELQDYELNKSKLLGYYDFGARYYNPVLGRWFNPDPALQTTNPYLFCGNSPIFYTDPDGRWFGLDDLIAAAVGAIFNSVSGLISGDIKSVGHFFASAGAGALAGLATIYTGPVASGAFLAGANSTLSQGFNNGWGNIHWNSVIFDSFVGGLTAGISSEVSGALSPLLNKITGNIASPVVQEAVNQSVVGTATGFTVGTSVSLIQGQSFEEALRAGGTNALFGLTMGAINGTVDGYQYAQRNGLSPWTGAEKPLDSKTYFNKTKYTKKVVKQMNNESDLHHSFPKSLDGIAAESGTVSIKKGGDGKMYHWLEVPGQINGKSGTFVYIKDPVTNKINHRYFQETKTPKANL